MGSVGVVNPTQFYLGGGNKMKIVIHYKDDKVCEWGNYRYDIMLCGKSTIPIDSCVYHIETSCRDEVTCESCKQILRERECRNYHGGYPVPASSFDSNPFSFDINCNYNPPKTDSCGEIRILVIGGDTYIYEDVSNLLEMDGVVTFIDEYGNDW